MTGWKILNVIECNSFIGKLPHFIKNICIHIFHTRQSYWLKEIYVRFMDCFHHKHKHIYSIYIFHEMKWDIPLCTVHKYTSSIMLNYVCLYHTMYKYMHCTSKLTWKCTSYRFDIAIYCCSSKSLVKCTDGKWHWIWIWTSKVDSTHFFSLSHPDCSSQCHCVAWLEKWLPEIDPSILC